MGQSSELLYVLVVFSGILILVAVVFLFLFYRFIKEKNETLKEKFEKKLNDEALINQAELLALRSQMNPHFVFNALNTVLYFIHQNDMGNAEDFLAKVSCLMRNFFDYSRQKDLTIKEELEFINHYLEIEQLRFEDRLTYDINIDETIDVEIARIPSMILQPIIENAVNHGIFHKSGIGKVDVFFEAMQEDSYKITILDNGIGINDSYELYRNKKKRFGTRSGNVLEERLRLLKASKQWDIGYTIEDLSDIGYNHSGTRVTLTIEAL